MRGFWKIIEWTTDKLKVVGAACLVGMTFLTCADVVGRFFRHPIFGSVEIVTFMGILAVAMALPYTHQVSGHIGVEILVRMLSDRKQAIIDIVTGFLSLGLFALVTWRMTVYARTIEESGEVSMNLEFPIHIIIYIVAFCLLIFTLIIVQEIVQNIAKLKDQ
ncbi:MAG: TRAP transporter small permease [Desulfobacterales bacterium]|nr:MAG: TRAP transporter small permease [Desulfobacterales bacterium]